MVLKLIVQYVYVEVVACKSNHASVWIRHKLHVRMSFIVLI